MSDSAPSVPTTCAECWGNAVHQTPDFETAGGGCAHYWQDRATELYVALEDLTGEVNETGIPSVEQPALFDSWLRATVVLQQRPAPVR